MERLSKIGFCKAHRKYKDIEMFDELCKYQETGLSPDEITKLNDSINSQCAKLLAKNIALQAENERLKKTETLRPLEEWHEDYGNVIWWTVPICEPPHVGTPLDCDWIEDYYTHWSVLPDVKELEG